MAALLRLLLQLRIFSPALRPLVRLVVGFIAVPLFRKFATRVFRTEELDREQGVGDRSRAVPRPFATLGRRDRPLTGGRSILSGTRGSR